MLAGDAAVVLGVGQDEDPIPLPLDAAGWRRDVAGWRRDVADHARRYVERPVDGFDRDPHLQPQLIAGHVIGRLRRTARILPPVGKHLRLHQVDDERPERLWRDDVRPGRIFGAAGAERRVRLADLDPGDPEDPEQLDRGAGVVLRIKIDHIRERSALGPDPLLGLPPAHPVDVVEVVLLQLRPDRHDRSRPGQHVVHRVAHMPAAAQPRVGAACRRPLRREAPGSGVERIGDLVRLVAPRGHVPASGGLG